MASSYVANTFPALVRPALQVRINKQILVGTMADTLHCYTGKGIKQYSLYMPASIICMHLLATTTSRMTKCVVVALSNGEVRVYNDKSLVSVHTSTSPVSALCAGRYAREDNSLITVTEAGGLDIKVRVHSGRGFRWPQQCNCHNTLLAA